MTSEGIALDVLKSHFGYDRFLPLQNEIISNVLDGNDTLALMPTGGGKSVCYQVPALCLDGLTLVVSPLIALMKDQVDGLKANGVAAEFFNSTLSASESAGVRSRAGKGELKILYVAPERLALPAFRGFLRNLRVQLIAIDEAHCISEWGHDFRAEYRNLKGLRLDFPGVPVIALTATATEKVQEDIIAQLGLQSTKTFLASFNRSNLNYTVRTKSRGAFDALVTLRRKHEHGSAIIYCNSRRDTERLADDLSAQGMTSLPYHAGLDNPVRRGTQEKFINGDVSTVVATIAFGMGIDKPDIRLVVHYDLPKTVEGYYQETGRAGRDGLPSECVLFYSYGDKRKQDYFIDKIEDPSQRKNAKRKLAQIIAFCELQTCSRKYLLEYFGERTDWQNCGGCDVCLIVSDGSSTMEEFDATEISHKILSAVKRTGERFGMSHVSLVLRGKKSTRVTSLGHDVLTVFGIARDFTDAQLKQIMRLLISKELLSKNGDEYPTISVTPAGESVVYGRQPVLLARPKQEVEDPPAKTGGVDTEVLAGFDVGLFERLRGLRRTIADSMGVPGFVIFSDSSLQQMAYWCPQSLNSFSGISGVGTVKLGEFGEHFVGAIREYSLNNGLVERSMPVSRTERSHPRQRFRPTYQETKRLFDEKLTIDEITTRRGLTTGTIIGHLERLIDAGEEVDIGYLLPAAARLAKIKAAFESSDSGRLAPIQELLGQEYSYEEIRLVRVYLRWNPDLPR